MRLATSLLLLLGVTAGLEAQEWNSAAARALAERAIERRRTVEADSGLQRYRATARGFVFFLAETGAEPAALTRLIKADQLTVEVYWEAPNRSKQNIVAWRDRAYLPTDIRYHRDHLGVVVNDFGDLIRLGDGDEVREAVHPLAPSGPGLYDFALTDSITLRSTSGSITVYALQVRPRDPGQPRIAGTLYLDTRSAAVVQFRFSFTPAAYRQADLEDITVVLEDALIDQRFWLPYRQEVEIRRRTAWLDVPFRTIIRGRWEIGDYDLTTRIPPAVLAGAQYGGLRRAGPDGPQWTEPLDSAVSRVEPGVQSTSVGELRREATRLIGTRASLAAPPKLAFGSVSDLARMNRVQGLALGVGLTVPVAPWRMQLRPSIGLGTADGAVTGGVEVRWQPGGVELSAIAERQVEDFSGWPVISGVLNSLMAQEGGNDHGDWVGVDRFLAAARLPLNDVLSLRFSGGLESSRSLETAATPFHGAYRPNPALGAGSVPLLRAGAHLRARDPEQGIAGSAGLEAGSAGEGYLRVGVEAVGRFPLGPGTMHLGLQAGAGTGGLPAYRGFVLGGRGTLPGEPFRAFGGRQAALLRAEWRLPLELPLPWLAPLPGASRAILAPFVALGAAGRSDEELPWQSSRGVRPVVGVASELLFQVFRIEAGYAPRSGSFGLTVDASPSWWPIL